jgi:peptidoglycan biosynthesis protein MviN/MurJ (putative lipid II flippase)
MFDYIKQKFKSESYRQILLVTSLLIISRFFGLIRTAIIGSSYIGESAIYSDIFINSQLIQDLLISVLIMGTLISTITPNGTKLLVENGEDYFNRYIRFNFWIIVFIFTIISTIVCISIDPILKYFLTEKYTQYSELGLLNTFVDSSRVLAFGVVFFAANTLLQVYLNIKNSFFWNNLTGIITNIFIIVTILNSPKNFVLPVALSLIASFIFSMFVHLFGAFQKGLNWDFFNLHLLIKDYIEFKKIFVEDLKIIIPKFFLIPLSLVAVYFVSRSKIIGHSTYYDNALNIQGVFLTIIMAIGMVILPKLSLVAYKETNAKFVKIIFNYIFKLAPLAFIGTLITFVFSKYILILVLSVSNFKKGNWSFINYSETEELQVNLIRIVSFGIIFLTLNEILIKYFLIKNQVKKLLAINTFTIAIFICLIFILNKVTSIEYILIVAYSYVAALGLQSTSYLLSIKFNSKKIK